MAIDTIRNQDLRAALPIDFRAEADLAVACAGADGGVQCGPCSCSRRFTEICTGRCSTTHGEQEWLSFYDKSPITPPGLYPGDDLFVERMKMKNLLCWMRNAESITHLDLAYHN